MEVGRKWMSWDLVLCLCRQSYVDKWTNACLWKSWCVTKLCVSDGAWKSGVCARLFLCVANAVWNRNVMPCLANLCQTWCVTKVVSDKAVCVCISCVLRIILCCTDFSCGKNLWRMVWDERWVCDRVVGSKQSETTSHCSERRRKSETHPCQTLQPWKMNKN